MHRELGLEIGPVPLQDLFVHLTADRAGTPFGPLWRTADWGYLRLHYGDADPPPNYHRQTLGTWAERIAGTFDDAEDVFAYFNNDWYGNAVVDAEWLRDRLTQPVRA